MAVWLVAAAPQAAGRRVTVEIEEVPQAAGPLEAVGLRAVQAVALQEGEQLETVALQEGVLMA